MYDAFAKIDGNLVGAESGRDGDDLRIEMGEWVKGYKSVTGYGFAGLSPDRLKSKADAKQLFAAIDDNGGGFILMDEWCEWLKQQEQQYGYISNQEKQAKADYDLL